MQEVFGGPKHKILLAIHYKLNFIRNIAKKYAKNDL